MIFISTLFITSCNNHQKRENINFYYWKTNVDIGDTEKKFFEELGSKKLYIRYFDVDLDTRKNILPKSKVKTFDPSFLNTQYVPVVFIVNDVFKVDNTPEAAQSLAHKISELIRIISDKNKVAYSEIQIDCDWTNSTQKQYFIFLQKLAEISGKEVTCTLRLHQIKDRKQTGIPPVTKGYLMCYATSSPQETHVENSILNLDLLKNYTKDIDTYPLPFAVALPIYSWGVITNHLGNIKLINNIDISNVSDKFLKKTGANTYQVEEDFFLQGFYLNKGFTIRIETISPELLDSAKNYLDKKINKDYEIVYYHLDKPFLEKYTIDQLKN